MTMSMFDLTGRVALVTGSSRGIGLALARALGAAGATIVLNARTLERLERAREELKTEGLMAHAVAADVTDPRSVERLVGVVEQEIGPIEILVNNAGSQHRAPFLEFPIGAFQELIDVNLVAPFLMSQTVGTHMARRRHGKIVNIGSVQSLLGRPTIVPYATTKGGLKLMTRGLCAELAPLGVQVNAIAPGYFETELTKELVDDPDFTAWVRSRTPAGRWGSVDELAGAIVFLASDASSFVNGQILYVDGGMTAVV